MQTTDTNLAVLLDVEAATDVFANAMTDAMLRTDPLLRRAPVLDSIRREAAMAATDIGQMILGVADPDAEFGRSA